MIGAMVGTGSEGSSAETTYGLIAQLPVVIESYSLEPLVRAFSPAFTRYTTLVRLHGAGEDGLGEDVTPFEPAQHAFASSAAELPLSGFWTIESFAACLDEVEPYDGPQLPPGFPKTFRRWALERECRPVTFVNSLSFGDGGIEEVNERVARFPSRRFNRDPAADWSYGLI